MTDKELYERFRVWWNTEGVFYDPDTEDVPWFDKRRELAEYAFIAGHKTIDPIDTRTNQELASAGLVTEMKGDGMASVGDIEVKILCEARKPVTVCADCANMRKAVDFTAHGTVPTLRCLVQRVAFTSHAPAQFIECEKINTDGNCKYYIEKATVAVEEPKLSLWQKIKSLGR